MISLAVIKKAKLASKALESTSDDTGFNLDNLVEQKNPCATALKKSIQALVVS